jgi:hypothetical protein
MLGKWYNRYRKNIMLIKTITKETTKTSQEIWSVYKDVSNWKTWDNAVISSELFGDFAVGTKGVLKPKGGPSAKFILTEVTENKSFSDRSFLPLAHIDFIHTIEDLGSKRKITHTIEMGGFLAPVFKLLIGKTLASGLEEAVETICK